MWVTFLVEFKKQTFKKNTCPWNFTYYKNFCLSNHQKRFFYERKLILLGDQEEQFVRSQKPYERMLIFLEILKYIFTKHFLLSFGWQHKLLQHKELLR